MRLLVGAAALFLMAAAPSSIQGRPDAVAERQEVRAEEELSAHREEVRAVNQMVVLTRWQIFLGWLTAFGLAGSLVMTLRALKQTRESLDLSHLVAREELRAYLGFDKFEGFRLDADGSVRLSYKFINNGATPASKVVMSGVVNLLDHRPRTCPLEDLTLRLKSKTFDIAPNTRRGFFITINANASDLIFCAENGGGCAVVRLHISYKDCFGRSHELDYSEMRYGPEFSDNYLNRLED